MFWLQTMKYNLYLYDVSVSVGFSKESHLVSKKLLRDLVCALGETSRTGDSPAVPT